MKSAQIKVGEDYAVQRYGDYNPGAWKTWRGLWTDRMRAVSAPKGGQVVMQHIGADGQPENRLRSEVSTRHVQTTWEQHLGYVNDAEKARQNYLQRARDLRSARAAQIKAVGEVLEETGVDMVKTDIRTTWSFREEIDEIVQDLADLGYIVSLDPLYVTDEQIDRWVDGTSDWYSVFSPAGVAGVFFGKDALVLSLDELMGVYNTGVENA